MNAESVPQIFIIGGGFGGLAAAKGLAKVNAEVAILDRKNHHVFQPLLYQVATASLSPADISAPIRSILRDQKNCKVALTEVTGIDVENKRVYVPGGYACYDYLILAAGATHAYFGNDHWAQVAPGLKTLEDATNLRRRILLAFESAEYEGSEQARHAALTFAIVGGGPTGVELAGAIKEIAGKALPKDYRNIDTRTTRVILFQSGNRILPTFSEELSRRAEADLEKLGVEVRLNSRVTDITPQGISIGELNIPVRNVFWAAGVKASPLGSQLGVPLNKSGCVIVGPDLTIPGHPEVFVIGDMAAATSADTNSPIPGVAQAGIQMGKYVGRVLSRELAGKSTPADRKPFVYKDKGSMAIIGSSKAIAEIGSLKFGGFLAWLAWGFIHIAFLVGFRNRSEVLMSWFLSWLSSASEARLITGDSTLEVVAPRSVGFVRVPPTSENSQTGTSPDPSAA
ncbi:NAD(P)/FAD-dependent oxidoreductase [Planctomicrobium sp. SH668]|uniref:NAD(P)/FAD-dependent oxidoreductase n=1 Tax=Planctomicrobium sp. SH668 TaxID=3448126 RepID=UPI003F5BB414